MDSSWMCGRRLAPLAVSLALISGAAQAKVQLSGASGKLSHDCGSDPSVNIDASNVEVRLTGACDRIDISGTNVVVRAEGVGKVEISGLSNTLEWQFATGGRSRPSVEQNGFGHRVVKVDVSAKQSASKSAAPSGGVSARSAEGGTATIDSSGVTARSGSSAARVDATGVSGSTSGASVQAGGAIESETSTVGVESGSGGIRITGSGIRRRVDCGGSKVQVLGDDVEALLLGDCPNVQVAGDRAEIWIERVDQLQILGEGSRAFYVGSTDGDHVKVSLVGAGATARAVSREELAERRKR